MSTQAKSLIKEMRRATIVPVVFMAICWVVFYFDHYYPVDFYDYGVRPRTSWGILGILFMPFIHGDSDFSHILNNTFPILVLGWSLFYFYKEVSWKVFLGVWIIGGFWLWCLSRDSYHIGASGIIYGLASFIFFSGWIRRNIRLMSLSLFVVFLYGSMIWGVLPIDPSISFEGHFWGGFAGLLLALWYRKTGPQREKYQWEIEEELGIEPPDLEGEYRRQQEEVKRPVQIVYRFKPKNPPEDQTNEQNH